MVRAANKARLATAPTAVATIPADCSMGLLKAVDLGCRGWRLYSTGPYGCEGMDPTAQASLRRTSGSSSGPQEAGRVAPKRRLMTPSLRTKRMEVAVPDAPAARSLRARMDSRTAASLVPIVLT
jgi:hypothetical protein